MTISSLNISGVNMPGGDFDAAGWLLAFAHCLAVNRDPPEMWPALGVTEESSARISALVKAFDAALAVAHNPSSNTRANIEAKTLARNAAVRAVREVVNAVRSHPDISDRELLALNLPTSRDRKRKREREQAVKNRASRVRPAHTAV